MGIHRAPRMYSGADAHMTGSALIARLLPGCTALLALAYCSAPQPVTLVERRLPPIFCAMETRSFIEEHI